MSYLNGDNQVVYANNFFSGQASECQNAATHTGNLISKKQHFGDYPLFWHFSLSFFEVRTKTRIYEKYSRKIGKEIDIRFFENVIPLQKLLPMVRILITPVPMSLEVFGLEHVVLQICLKIPRVTVLWVDLLLRNISIPGW